MPKSSSRKPKGKTKSINSAERLNGELLEVLKHYAGALQSTPGNSSFGEQIPELKIRSTLQALFPDVCFRGRRDWACRKPLSIRRAYKEFANCRGGQERLFKAFELIREIVFPCYRSADLGWVDARLLASGENLGEEFQGFALTEEQIQTVNTDPSDLQQAMQSVIHMADMWPMDFQDAYSRDHYGRCLTTLAQVLKDRSSNKIKSLDKALGLAGSGRGKSSDRKKLDTNNSWNDNCFDIHLLHLSGYSIPQACERYVKNPNTKTKTNSAETAEKQYHKWRAEPVTAVRLFLGDPLAKRILSFNDVRAIIAGRFPSID